MKVELGLGPQNKVKKLSSRDELMNSIKEFKKKYNDENKVPRPSHWSGWNLSPSSIEFWLDGDNRIHERLKYTMIKMVIG
jgi:pyridoxamine 5'-phosphate oxidase